MGGFRAAGFHCSPRSLDLTYHSEGIGRLSARKKHSSVKHHSTLVRTRFPLGCAGGGPPCQTIFIVVSNSTRAAVASCNPRLSAQLDGPIRTHTLIIARSLPHGSVVAHSQ